MGEDVNYADVLDRIPDPDPADKAELRRLLTPPASGA